MERWYRFLGVRPHETTSVWLLFAHNSLLSFGTVLAYLAATALLLARHPAASLPVAYCVGALAMGLTGSLYTYLERRWPGPQLAVRALLAAVAIALVLALALAGQPAPSVAMAVAIMTGYRLLYLLSNLEAWSMAAILFNARQGRRLFGVVSSGELPAKAVGAALAIFVPAAHAVSLLLIMALSAYLLAALVQQAAFRRTLGLSHELPGRPAGRTLPLLRPLLGPRALVRGMGLSVMAVAAVAVGVEYVFLLRVRAFLPGPVAVPQYLGGVLALAYLLAAAGRLLFARRGLAWVGVRRTLLLLSIIALGSVLLFWVLWGGAVGPAGQLVYGSGLFLGLEICRRALFEPVFMVLFHRLPPPGNVAGHGLVKGIYEPVGVGLGGLLLLAAQPFQALNPWLPFAWMAILLVGVVFLLRQMLWHYLEALKASLHVVVGDELADKSGKQPDGHLAAADSSVETVLQAIEHLHQVEAAALLGQAEHLLTHPNNRIRHRVLRLLGPQVALRRLWQLAQEDPDPALREMASCLAGPHPATDDLLRHPDWAVRQGAIRGRLGAHPTDGAALASLAAVAASAETSARHAALGLIGLLTPEQQQQAITTCLHSAEPGLVQAAVRAVAEVPGADMIRLMLSFLCIKKVHKPATAGLVRIGASVLPLLRSALAQETDPRRAQALVQVCARLATPAARQVLLEVISSTNLQARAAALRALDSFATMPADAPLFQQLIEDEMRLAQHFLHGMHGAKSELRDALRQELRHCAQRLFGLLRQIYERPPLLEAQHGAIHTTGKTQASALEILENMIPLPLFAGLQAMLETGRLSQRAEVMDALLGPITTDETVPTTIVRRGAEAFMAWTISVALRQWHPQPATVAYLVPHLQASNLLVQESAVAVLQQLPVLRPAAYDQLLLAHPAVAFLAMNPPTTTPRTSARERVLILKGTALFANTPESILGNIEPIMRELTFEAGQEIFRKGSLGTSLFIVSEGEIGIFDGSRQLTTFRSGDFFGELALLDAEARSATAVALGPATAFRIDQEDFYDVMEDCPEVTRNILKVLCQRLRRQNERMQPPQPVAG